MKELVQNAQAGQICSFGVKFGASAEAWLKAGGQLRPGMVLLDKNAETRASRQVKSEGYV
jgi:hypothetical protein